VVAGWSDRGGGDEQLVGTGISGVTRLGKTWEEKDKRITFAEGSDQSVERIWSLVASGGDLLAGVDPATVFRSGDGGETWSELTGLGEHSTRDQWFPGAGGLMVHAILPRADGQLFVGISAAGVFRSVDDGANWSPRNSGVRADFLPDKFPEVGQCVHCLTGHPTEAEVLYQQNHCGVYRTENGGMEWTDITEGLPSRFGFPIAVHPHAGDTIYVVPEESDQNRVTCGGAFRVFRSKNRGATWEPLTRGLPQVNAHQNVLRAAMAMDACDEAGIYVGTQGGQLLASRDAGDHWETILNWLPPVFSIEAAVVE